MGNMIALITLGCFAVLASYSIGRYHPDAKPPRVAAKPVVLWVATAYSDNNRKAMDRLLGEIEKESAERDCARQIAAIWNVTPENMGSDIFGGDQ